MSLDILFDGEARFVKEAMHDSLSTEQCVTELRALHDRLEEFDKIHSGTLYSGGSYPANDPRAARQQILLEQRRAIAKQISAWNDRLDEARNGRYDSIVEDSPSGTDHV